MTRPARTVLRLCGIAGLTLLLAWGAGFVWFVRAASRPAPPPPHADGIVAFTGGAARVETALHMLADGRADRLLLSGVGGGAELGDLAMRARVAPEPLASRVTLGRTALSTRGNAAETAAWARANGVRSLIVVTAFYHMPRALAELHRALPEVRLFPQPVLSGEAPGASGPGQRVPLRLLAEEYTKFLAAVTGITHWLPARPPPHGHAA